MKRIPQKIFAACAFAAIFPLVAASGAAGQAVDGSGSDNQEENTKNNEVNLHDIEKSKLFEESLEQLLPLDSGQIKTFIKKRDAVEGAVEPGPALMRTQTRQIAVTPGAVPQVILLTSGYSSTLVFQDSTGAPWPVLSTVLGSSRAFDVSQPKVEREILTAGQADNAGNPAQARAQAQAGGQTVNISSNVINIVPMTNHAASNLVVTLENAPYPIVLHLLTESQAKDGRVSDALVVFRLDKQGPNATMPQIEPTSAAETTVTPEMLEFVHGVAPRAAAAVTAKPNIPGLSVWEYKNRLYLRSVHPAVWPAWTAAANGDDVRVYLMPKTPSIVVSVNGVHQKITLEAR